MQILKKILIQAKWILLPVTIILFILFIEAATDSYGITSSEDGIMYGAWICLIANVGLFLYNDKWCALLDRLIK